MPTSFNIHGLHNIHSTTSLTGPTFLVQPNVYSSIQSQVSGHGLNILHNAMKLTQNLGKTVHNYLTCNFKKM